MRVHIKEIEWGEKLDNMTFEQILKYHRISKRAEMILRHNWRDRI
jgi:hypothetical protein